MSVSWEASSCGFVSPLASQLSAVPRPEACNGLPLSERRVVLLRDLDRFLEHSAVLRADPLDHSRQIVHEYVAPGEAPNRRPHARTA